MDAKQWIGSECEQTHLFTTCDQVVTKWFNNGCPSSEHFLPGLLVHIHQEEEIAVEIAGKI